MLMLFSLSWTVIGWGIAALILLFILSLFGLRTRFGPTNQVDIFNVDDLMSAGLFGCLFGIVAMPFVIISTLISGPEPPPPALPVETGDWCWGRENNKKVAEKAFRKIQEALTACDPKIAKSSVDEMLYPGLKHLCQSYRKQDLVNVRKDIVMKEIAIGGENSTSSSSDADIKTHWFHAAIKVTMVNCTTAKNGEIRSGSREPQDFEEEMLFCMSYGSVHWVALSTTSIPDDDD